jgi:actin-like ATPase involved in cell morphogenesis
LKEKLECFLKMILRYCIRTCKQRESISSQLANNLKRYIPNNVSVDIVNDENGKLSASGLIKYFDMLLSKNIQFDAIVILDDTVVVNKHIHDNINK